MLRAAAIPGGDRLSYDGSLFGPVVRVRRGTVLAVTLQNDLGAATSLQWHGLRGAAAAAAIIEGTATVPPGGSTTTTIRASEPGLSWFHPAARAGQAGQAAAGLRGILIVEEDDPPVVDLDLLLVIEDGAGQGFRINGVPAPGRGILPPGGRVRLRLLNATTSRLVPVGIDGAPCQVIAIDGQPSSLFPPLRGTVPLGPGARFELMVDAPATAGTTVAVVARALPGSADASAPVISLYELATSGEPRAHLPPLVPLPPNPALPPAIPLERSIRAKLTVEAAAGVAPGQPRWRLNGVANNDLPAKPLFAVKAGSAVTLSFENRSSVPLPVRVHGQAMRLLHAKDDGWEPYWRDSVILPPGAVTLVAFVADAPGPWSIDSTDAEQAATGLRTWFAVTGGAT